MSVQSWGEVKGTTQSDKLEYTVFKNGSTTVRIVSGILPDYKYWLTNKDGKKAPFSCLRFNRKTERFSPEADPVQDLGFTMKDPKDAKKLIKLKPQSNYQCWVINRDTGKLEVMTVKAGILKGIKSIMKDLELTDPSCIDFVIDRTGSGFNDTEYTVSAIKAMRFLSAKENPESPESKSHEKDKEILGENMEKVRDLGSDVFPVPTYDEQYKAIQSFMEGKKDKEADGGEVDKEAVSELD